MLFRSAYETLCNELSNYSDLLMEKPRIVLCNKVDIPGAHDRAVEIADKIHQTEAETPVIPISVLTGNGMKDARNHIISLVDRLEKRTESKENKEEKAFGSSFMEERAGFEDDDENVQYPGSEN